MNSRTRVRTIALGGLLALAACAESALAPAESIPSPTLPNLALRSPLVYARCDEWRGDPDWDATCVTHAMVILEPERGERYLLLKPQSDGFYGTNPAWSPDGQTIAFTGFSHCGGVEGDSCSSDIHLIKPDGTGVTRLTHSPSTWNSQPAWSPDSRKIVYVMRSKVRQPVAAPQLRVVDVRGGEETSLGGLFGDSPAWSPDGKRIAFSASGEGDQFGIHIADADGSNLMRLTGGRGWSDSQPAWSPDGRTLAFTRFTSSGISVCQVWVMGADGSSPHALTKEPFCAGSPAWLPDGKLAFNSGRRILVINADGTGLSHVRSLGDMGEPSRVSWAPLP